MPLNKLGKWQRMQDFMCTDLVSIVLIPFDSAGEIVGTQSYPACVSTMISRSCFEMTVINVVFDMNWRPGQLVCVSCKRTIWQNLVMYPLKKNLRQS